MTRSLRPGYIRDLRRLTVALSRARLGLYVLGRRSVFESVYELRPAFEKLLARPANLGLVTGEMFPTARELDDDVESTEMAGVEHLGKYVFEMTKAAVEQMKAGERKFITPVDPIPEEDEDDQGPVEDDVVSEEDDDDEVE